MVEQRGRQPTEFPQFAEYTELIVRLDSKWMTMSMNGRSLLLVPATESVLALPLLPPTLPSMPFRDPSSSSATPEPSEIY